MASSDEKDKASGTPNHLYFSKTSEINANPLVYNKGSLRKEDTSLVRKKSKNFTTMYVKKTSEFTAGALCSGELSLPTDTREIFALPLFGIPHTMHALTKRKHCDKAEVKEEEKVKVKGRDFESAPSKSVSMLDKGSNGMKAFEEKLSKEQCEFRKSIYAYKGNYFHDTLSYPEVHNQYISIIYEMGRISDSEVILKQLADFSSQAKKYRKRSKNKGRVCANVGKKTCLLDLDETLIGVSFSDPTGALYVYNYIEEDNEVQRKQSVSY
eukprot:TRINITY_DN1814_c0_g3_i6.p1 TRINITY_DN1814_c0_g3~~TRINITY_DN1814_c0_g3_i6.p1  ORF type:complete len:268 (+),score=78.21 TRINITY_DN1814_c0_g3_i6:76-879(+)